MSLSILYQTLEQLPLPYLSVDSSYHIVWSNSCLQRRFPYIAMMRSVEPLLLGHDRKDLLQKLSEKQEGISMICRLPLMNMTMNLSPLAYDEEGNVQEILFALPGPLTETTSDHTFSALSKTLRLPMDGMFSTVAYLRKQLEDTEDHDELLKMIQACYQLLRSCISMGEYNDLVADSRPLNIRHQDLSAYLLKTLNPVIDPLKRRDIDLTLDLPNGNILVPFDADKMTTVLFSLISNSCTFCENHNQITVSASIDETEFHLTVSDHGFGIDPDIMQKVMEPYFSQGMDGEEKPGLGLGLTLCKIIAERHGGKIHLESQPDHGLSVKISLPLYNELTISGKKLLRSDRTDYLVEQYPLHFIFLSTVLPAEELQ